MINQYTRFNYLLIIIIMISLFITWDMYPLWKDYKWRYLLQQSYQTGTDLDKHYQILDSIIHETGDFEGHVPGMNQKYAHTKTFRDFTITFLMDQDHLPFKMLHKWAEFIFPFQNTNGVSMESATTGPLLRNYVLTNYYNEYTCNMVIDKIEHDPVQKQLKDKLPVKSTIFLYNVYPYLINDVTVSNGPNQPLKFQASFFFEYSKVLR